MYVNSISQICCICIHISIYFFKNVCHICLYLSDGSISFPSMCEPVHCVKGMPGLRLSGIFQKALAVFCVFWFFFQERMHFSTTTKTKGTSWFFPIDTIIDDYTKAATFCPSVRRRSNWAVHYMTDSLSNAWALPVKHGKYSLWKCIETWVQSWS